MSEPNTRSRAPLWVALGVAALVAAAFLTDRERPPVPAVNPADDSAPRREAEHPNAVYPGVRQPPAVAAAAADLDPTEMVIGVVVNGKARAYRVRALKGLPQDHVVNDVLGARAVTVSYCDLGNCVRVFAGGAEPLDVRVGGYKGGMVLVVDGRTYRQEDGRPLDPAEVGEIPLSRLPFEWTTWQKWRDAHPDTDVYQDRPPPQSEPAAPAPAAGKGRPADPKPKN